MNDFEQLRELAARRRAVNWHEEHFERLWLSTRGLHDRFGITPEIDSQAALIREEAEEVIAAARDEGADELAAEIADCIVVLMGMGMARGIALDRLQDAMNAVIAKNDAKTHETHYVNPATHKITRKA